MKLFHQYVKNKEGQSVIFIVILLTLMVGFAAFSIDIGLLYKTERDMQNIVDAAALAGAQDLPKTQTGKDAALQYAIANGAESTGLTITSPYEGEITQIEVTYTQPMKYSFAHVLGFSQRDVTVRAVAESKSHWDGEALPYVNLDDDYTVDPELVAWEKTGPGDFESITRGDGEGQYQIYNGDDPNSAYMMVDYENGIMVKKGTVATVKQEVGYVYERAMGEYVYVLSMKEEVINSGVIMLTDGTTKLLDDIANGDMIDPSQLVLLECIFHDYDYTGKSLFLTVVEYYDFHEGELPINYVSPDGKSSKLVQ